MMMMMMMTLIASLTEKDGARYNVEAVQRSHLKPLYYTVGHKKTHENFLS